MTSTIKNAVVTGGATGIGRLIMDGLLSDGFMVSVCSRSGNKIDDLIEETRSDHPGQVRGYVSDVSEPKSVESMFDAIQVDCGHLDVLVNNAAVAGPVGPLEKIDSLEWQAAHNINVLGAVNCCRAALPEMKKRKSGRIINVCGGGVGWRALKPNRSAYIASKFALYGLTEALACEVSAFGIMVNAISPGSMATDLRDKLITQDAEHDELEVDAGNICRLVSFLASERSGGLTGKILSAHWDDLDYLASDWKNLNDSCELTLRKIDRRNYTMI